MRSPRTVTRRAALAGLIGLIMATSGCGFTRVAFQDTSCHGTANDPVGCAARMTFDGVTYIDSGYVALTDEAVATVTRSGTVTEPVAWPPNRDPNARPMIVLDPGVNNYADATVWVVPGIDGSQMVLLGPFPQEWDTNLYEMFLAQDGPQDFPVALCAYLKPRDTSKAGRPPECL